MIGFQNLMTPIFKIAFSGGPVGGKTKSIDILSKKLTKIPYFEPSQFLNPSNNIVYPPPPLKIPKHSNFKIFTVPEAATLVFGTGVEVSKMTSIDRFQITKQLMKTQIHMEDTVMEIAKIHYHRTGQPCILLCDRGLNDNEAYFRDPILWELMKHDNNWTVPGMRDGRYDKIIHMVSTAIGAENIYNSSFDDNNVRIETPEEAAILDNKILNAYVGHQFLSIIDNSTGIEQKIDRCYKRILDLVGTSIKFMKNQLKTQLEKGKIGDYWSGVEFSDVGCFGETVIVEPDNEQNQKNQKIKKEMEFMVSNDYCSPKVYHKKFLIKYYDFFKSQFFDQERAVENRQDKQPHIERNLVKKDCFSILWERKSFKDYISSENQRFNRTSDVVEQQTFLLNGSNSLSPLKNKNININNNSFFESEYIIRRGQYGDFEYFYKPPMFCKHIPISVSQYLNIMHSGSVSFEEKEEIIEKGGSDSIISKNSDEEDEKLIQLGKKEKENFSVKTFVKDTGLREIAPGTRTIMKRKRYFVFNNQSYAIVEVNNGQYQFIEVSVDEYDIKRSLKNIERKAYGDNVDYQKMKHYSGLIPPFILQNPAVKEIIEVSKSDKDKFSDYNLSILRH